MGHFSEEARLHPASQGPLSTERKKREKRKKGKSTIFEK
jgi:hypothetical protein